MTAFFERLESADKCATLAINSLHCPASDAVWMFFSDKLVWAPLYLLVIFFLFRKLGWRKALAVTLSAVLTILLCDQLGNLCKNGTMRLRPCYDAFMVSGGLRLLEGEGNLFGFYSAHAANAMGFALVTALGFRLNGKGHYAAYSCLIVLWALLVGASRIFVGKHFLGDVLTGFAVGALVGTLCAILAHWAVRRQFRK